jgi:hypothetical protein
MRHPGRNCFLAAAMLCAAAVSPARACTANACKDIRITTEHDGCYYVQNVGAKPVSVRLGKVGEGGGKFAVSNSIPPGQRVRFTVMGKCFPQYLGGETADYE